MGRRQELEKLASILILRDGQLPEPVQPHIWEDNIKHDHPLPERKGHRVSQKTKKSQRSRIPQRDCRSLWALEEAASTLSFLTSRLGGGGSGSLGFPHLYPKPTVQPLSNGATPSHGAAINGHSLAKLILTFLFYFGNYTQASLCCTRKPFHPSVWEDDPILALLSSPLSATFFYFPYCNYFWIINTPSQP